VIAGSPVLIAFRKKTRAKDSATTAVIPAPASPDAACSRALPQPKFRPATMTLLARTRAWTSGPSGSKTCHAVAAPQVQLAAAEPSAFAARSGYPG